MDLLTYERACELFSYDSSTGFLSRKRAIQGARAGVVGSSRYGAYRSVHVDGRSYMVHRVIWLMVYGVWPSDLIDHINGNPNDNSLSNLRAATHSQNMQNAKRSKNNTSGFKGVSFIRKAGRYQATIQVDRRSYNLGHFLNPESAHAAYVSAAKRLHGSFARAG